MFFLTAARSQLKSRSGQSIVELAIVLPVLFAIVVGIFEFGRAWNVRQVITNTAREGARLAVIPSSTEADVRAAVDAGLTAASLDPGLGAISISGLGGGTGTPSVVQISYPYTFQFLGPAMGLLGGDGGAPAGTITMTTNVTMRNE